MTTVTIPADLIKEKDLMLISRLKYENLLKYLKIVENDENLWKRAVKHKFFKSYSKSDAIYDQV